MTIRIVRGVLIGACLVIAVEVIVRQFVTHALGQGRLFTRDPVAGWSLRKDLDLRRRNPAGEEWTVSTGPCGYRGPCDWSPQADRRLLVLGDSFAFGEGVSLDERFDSQLARALPRWSIVNLGVMGYGTDQELLVSRPFASRLERGDVVLVVVYGNDFFDIVRKRFAGRPKPWFELAGAGVIEHPPTFSWWDHLRDVSYLTAVAGRLVERDAASYTAGEIEGAFRLLHAMLAGEIGHWSENGIAVVLARHGMDFVTAGRPAATERQLSDVWEALCERGHAHCADLDPVLRPGGMRQSDGHWNAEGHRRVSEHLQGVLAAAVAR